jgi:hypothetical protein
MSSPNKITVNAGNESEWVAAEVVSVDYMQKTRDRLYTIYCKILSGGSTRRPSDVIQARALHANIKNIPIVGEIVFVCLAPTPFQSGASNAKEYYYTMPISRQSSVHHNGLPGANDLKDVVQDTKSKMSLASLGVTTSVADNNSTKKTIDPTFPERKDLFPIQPFSGDVIIEGRWGQSIRLGSTVDLRRSYISPPNWDKGKGITGNPITIISNGTNPNSENKKHNEFHIESPDDDDASIWLTSGQSVKFNPASKYSPSITDKEVDLFRKNDYGGNQIILASDRLVLNAKKQEIVGFAKEGIGFATEKCLVLNAKNIVELEGGKIALGFNATSPILLGDRVVEMLGQILYLLIDMNRAIALETHPTGVGPSGPPLNAGEFVGFITNLNMMLSKLPSLASKFAFVNEYAEGPSASDRSKFSTLKTTDYVLPIPQKSLGDSSGGISFSNIV